MTRLMASLMSGGSSVLTRSTSCLCLGKRGELQRKLKTLATVLEGLSSPYPAQASSCGDHAPELIAHALR
jgi:hypothetical protein